MCTWPYSFTSNFTNIVMLFHSNIVLAYSFGEANIFCKWPDITYVKLCVPYSAILAHEWVRLCSNKTLLKSWTADQILPTEHSLLIPTQRECFFKKNLFYIILLLIYLFIQRCRRGKGQSMIKSNVQSK